MRMPPSSPRCPEAQAQHGGRKDRLQGWYGALSQRTKTIRMGHGVVQRPYSFHHPIRIAERIAVPDILSDGRLELATRRSVTGQHWWPRHRSGHGRFFLSRSRSLTPAHKLHGIALRMEADTCRHVDTREWLWPGGVAKGSRGEPRSSARLDRPPTHRRRSNGCFGLA